MVDNIHEIEPVVKKEASPPPKVDVEEEPATPGVRIDPAQMKLEL
jgi:hypothetical protein